VEELAVDPAIGLFQLVPGTLNGVANMRTIMGGAQKKRHFLVSNRYAIRPKNAIQLVLAEPLAEFDPFFLKKGFILS